MSRKEVAIPATRLEPSVVGRRGKRSPLKRAAANIAAFVVDEQAESPLSERVRRRREEQQVASEIIVGWIQACAIVLFAVVYAISPKAFPPGTRFEPVPWTLAIYAAFTAVRIVLAHRGRLSNGMVAISTVVDTAVLMIMIWSFHLQSQAPQGADADVASLPSPTACHRLELIALLGEYQSRLVPVIQRQHGSIDKYLGDGISRASAPSRQIRAMPPIFVVPLNS